MRTRRSSDLGTHTERVRETDVTAKLGLLQLTLDLVSTAWMAGLMNSGYIFRVEIQLVVSVAAILLVL